MVERTLDLVTCLVSGDAARFSMDPTQRTSSSRVPAHQVSEIGLRPDTKASFSFPPEPSVGKVEHKLRLTAEEGSERFEELVTQLNWRMRECSSAEECADLEELSQYRDALYRLGVSDDGQVPGLSDAELAESLSVLKAMAAQIPATVTVISQTGGIGPGNRTAITALVRACQSSFFLRGGDEVRICTVGNVDSGKSTLLGLLTQGLQDDGRGRARAAVFRHRHEIESGRTSSIATSTLGFDQTGEVVNYRVDGSGLFRSEKPHHNIGRIEAQARIAEKSSKLITFFDLCGHERYFKTTLQGMVGLNPDYLLCTVDANRGEMRGMVHEHLVVAHALGIPAIICLTKCDVADEERRYAALLDVKRYMKQLGSKTLVVKDANDAVLAAERILQGYSPIFLCSAVTGAMVRELKLLLNVMSRRPSLFQKTLQTEPDLQIQIDEVFPQVPGVGLVIAGRVLHGTARPGDAVRIGPIVDASGGLLKDGFLSLRISSIRVQDHPVEQLRAGSSGTFALKSAGRTKVLTPRTLSRSKFLVGTKSILAPTRWVKATVTVLQHPSSIRVRYEPVLHVGMTRQTARVMSMTSSDGEPVDLLRAGDSADILFRWAHWPEIVEPGCALVFRENSVKGIGTVTWVGNLDEPREERTKEVSRKKSKVKQTKSKRKGSVESVAAKKTDTDKKTRKGLLQDKKKSKRPKR